MTRTTNIVVAALGLACLMSAGCSKDLPAKELQGSVTCNGQKVPMGRVSFVPINGGTGRICVAPIVDGQYRTDAGGGVPLGKYRVQIDARKKTGRKVKGFNGIEAAMVDEEAPLGPKGYGDQNSPLVVEIKADSNGHYDIALPRQ